MDDMGKRIGSSSYVFKNISKVNLEAFVETGCQRQLLLNLGQGNEKWIKPWEDLVKLSRERSGDVILDLGHDYERDVYLQLCCFENRIDLNSTWVTKYISDKDSTQPHQSNGIKLTRAFLLALPIKMNDINASKFCLIEHDFTIEESFIQQLLGAAKKEDLKDLVSASTSIRPDIMIIEKINDTQGHIITEIGPGGEIVDLSGKDLKGRLAITVVDVKLLQEEKIGKRHFFEIYFYSRALAHYLANNKLNELYFVRFDHSGILPKREPKSPLKLLDNGEIVKLEPKIPPALLPVIKAQLPKILNPLLFNSIEAIEREVYAIPLTEAALVFNHVVESVHALYDHRPHKKESTPLKFQAICSRCNYFDDCLKTLNHARFDKEGRKDWDIHLLPFISQGIVNQLKFPASKNVPINTIGELIDNVDKLDIGDTPSPIFIEKPFLKMRASAVLDDTIKTPDDKNYCSMGLAPRTPITLTINFETDPVHDILMLAGFKLNCQISKDERIYEFFKTWWENWKIYQEKNITIEDLLKKIKEELPFLIALDTQIRQEDSELENGEELDDSDEELADVNEEDELVDDIEKMGKNGEPKKVSGGKKVTATKPAQKSTIEDNLRKFCECLGCLTEKETDNGTIFQVGDVIPEQNGKPLYQVNIEKYLINNGIDKDGEKELLRKIVPVLYSLIKIVEIIEFLFSKNSPGDSQAQNYLACAIFYWGTDQIDALEDFLERSLEFQGLDPYLRNQIQFIIKFFGTSDSSIRNPVRFNKLYDLKSFTETSMGFPLIINYTWHEVATRLKQLKEYQGFLTPDFNFDDRYWNPHFNYIDFERWFEFAVNPAGDKLTALIQQIKTKVNTINQLRLAFQQNCSSFLPSEVATEKFLDFDRYILPDEYHGIAATWYLFECLTASYDARENEKIRRAFPELGIGKLQAATADQITVIANPSNKGKPKYTIQFILDKKSRNMKIKEDDRIVLIPDIFTDVPRTMDGNWLLEIDSIKLVGAAFQVTSKPISHNILASYYATARSMCGASNNQQKANNLNIFIGDVNACLRYFKNINATKNMTLAGRPGKYHFNIYFYVDNSWKPKLRLLLNERNYGTSWLGKVLEGKLNLPFRSPWTWPDSEHYQGYLSEVYMFAPWLLPVNATIAANNKLITTIAPTPDDSQDEAIKNAIAHTIYGIQGPPGTGKSQTIVALIDEFVNRAKRPVKILVTAFAYTALEVIIKNILKAQDAQKKPLPIRNFHLVYVQSPNRKKYLGVINLHRAESKTWHLELPNNQSQIFNKKKKNILLDRFLHLKSESMIMFANAHYLTWLDETYEDRKTGDEKPILIDQDFAFDLIIVDEASQLPVNNFMAALKYVKQPVSSVVPIKKSGDDDSTQGSAQSLELKKLRIGKSSCEVPFSCEELTKVVMVGDQKQLPPVLTVKPPANWDVILNNLFAYYTRYLGVESKQLEKNYRSHPDIIDYTNRLKIYSKIKPGITVGCLRGNMALIKTLSTIAKALEIPDWVELVLDPAKVGISIIHDKSYDTSISNFEAFMVTKIILGYFLVFINDSTTTNPSETAESKEKRFWSDVIGVVAPHNAQGRLIIQDVFTALTSPASRQTQLKDEELMHLLQGTIYSVEKFQGSDRDIIIASVGISSEDQLVAEEEFIYDLNRFNVLTSRAKSKIIVIASKNYITYIPRNKNVLLSGSKIREYFQDFCSNIFFQGSILDEDQELSQVIFKHH